MFRPFIRRRAHREASGQSLVELALALPVLLLILLVALDFGRVFYSWVVLQNASRIGANFAGLNAEGWETDPDTPTTVAEYEALIAEDADRAPCDTAGSPAPPVFVDGTDTSAAGQTPDTSYDVGDSVKVSLTCEFHPLTPLVSAIIGGDLTVGASSEFRIRAGDIAGLANPVAIPRPSATAVPTPTPTATPTPTPTPSPTPACTITAGFSRSPNAGSVANGTDIVFTNTSTSSNCSIVSYAWSFGSGSPGSAAGVGPHTVDFSTEGSVTVTLVVTSSTGLTSSVSDSFTVRR